MPRMLRMLSLIVIASLLFALAPSARAQTGEPTREPILRIETGMHTAGITRIGVDRLGKFLVTASQDKTARVWELESGKLLRVLRVPFGVADDVRRSAPDKAAALDAEGVLMAIAISPDGKMIAVGGLTGLLGLMGPEPQDEKSLDEFMGNLGCVYIFDRESGRLVRRLTGSIPLSLAFSLDGALLATTSFLTSSVRLWRTSDWSEVGRDDSAEMCISADFDHAGRLVASCFGGNVHLYDAKMRLLEKKAAPGGKQPLTVRFSPDGRKIALGYNDSARVDVLSGDTLALLYSPDTGASNNASMVNVAWSMDGMMLYAGGSDKGPHIIRRWSDGGRGPYVDTTAANDAISDIAPLPKGGIVYAASNLWGILDTRGGQASGLQPGPIADYRDNLTGFLTNTNADSIRFGYEQFGKSPAVFQLSDRKLTPDTPAADDMRPPRTKAPGLSVTDWKDSATPRLNDKPLELRPLEMSLAILFMNLTAENLPEEKATSLAVGPDGERFLLGTVIRMSLFNRSGRQLWQALAPSFLYAVNISGDGRLAVAAFGDGTIRWYRMTDGKELLAFFPHKDRKRWILWTPSGYYDCSPGAEDLVGWHVNNGSAQAADFFPVGQFRDKFYRPDVVARMLKTLDEQLALKEANEERGLKQQTAKVEDLLPPVVNIISPSEGAQLSPGEVTIRYRLHSNNGEPVTNIMAMVDGKTIAVERGLSINVGQNGAEREIKIKLPAGASLISVLATNRNTPSVAATVHVSTGPAARGTEIVDEKTRPAKPTLYVLAVGVGAYSDGSGLPTLTYPAKDANDFAAALERQKGRRYQDVEMKVLPNATHDQVMDGLEWITKTATEKDVAMIFLAGHGIADGGDFYYFMPSDSELEHPKKRGVPFAEIENTLISLKGQKVLFVDTCRSGAVLGKRGIIDINGIANKLNRETSGVAVFTASMGNESAFEDSRWGNGAFTRALVDALSGQADSEHSGEITFSMLDRFLTKRVRELTANRQTPTATKPLTVPDFLVAELR